MLHPDSGTAVLYGQQGLLPALRSSVLCMERLASQPERDSLMGSPTQGSDLGQDWSPLKVKGW